MSFIVHKPVDIVDKRVISTYKRIIIVEKPVDNSEQMEENARNTEAGANSEPVDKSEEEQNPAGSRWEYMKTMESYKMALYMAASVKEMPHMMLNSAEYWKKWLEAEVDENGEKLSKK